MFAIPTNVGVTQRVVATLVACALVLFSVGVYNTAQAANLTNISDTLSNSDVSVVSDHTINFTIPAGSAGVAAGGGTIVVTFPAGFNMGSVAFGDIDLSVNSVDQALLAAPAGASWGAVVAGQVLTLTSGSAGAAATDPIVIKIGTNAAGGANQITNPTAGSYEIVVTAGADTGRTRVAIIDNVLVTAIVNTTFDFTITGLATSTAVNGTSTTGSTTATEIPFGVLVAGETKTLAQQLNVTTNAANGYVVTVEQDGNLRSSTGADIDGFIDGAYTDTPTDWDANLPSNSLLNENTWGHWGITSTDGNLQGGGTAFTAADQYIAASTTPRVIMAHNDPSDGTTGTADATGDDVGETFIGYQIQITPLQEAADDYQTTLTYIATPTF
ncbi:hypothetical protein H6784_00435 [Candidatus Nomurabacteria bacterium]|nr:hypothetical protein [Candidatus Kaiserbacteria bacterium]MCB9813860.1 hypothetical protein [Candidatus Nomurabacteria bacterium]